MEKRQHLKRKGFTIVELVIVIAVIAILAAVLIPTFSGIIKKANANADKQIIRNLNTALATDKITAGQHETMWSVANVAKSIGYDLDNLTAKALDNEILWDSVNDVFCYYDSDSDAIIYISDDITGEGVNSWDYWTVKTVNAQTDISEKYSTYLTAASTIAEITTSKGVDTGECENIVVNYTHNGTDATETEPTQKVVIRADSLYTTLSIDSSTDTVYVYGKAGSLEIIQVPQCSCFVDAEIPFISIAEGRVVLEENSNVDKIYIVTADKQNGIYRTNADATYGDASDNVIIATRNDVELPEVYRGKISIGVDEVVIIAEWQELTSGSDTATAENTDYIKLTARQEVVIGETVTTFEAFVSENKETTGTTAKEGYQIGGTEVEKTTLAVNAQLAGLEAETNLISTSADSNSKYSDLDSVSGKDNNPNVSLENIRDSVVAEKKEAEIASAPECYIDGVAYTDIEEAFEQVKDNEPITIKLNKNVFIYGNAGITISAKQDVTLDLNGYTFEGVAETAAFSSVFTVYGKFTVNDSSSDGSGCIQNSGLGDKEAGNWWDDPKRDYQNNIITNYGNTIINGGLIKSSLQGNICYCVDNLTNGTAYSPVLTINGGHLYNYYTNAIRLFCNSSSKENKAIINGGTIEGYSSVWVQNPNTSKNIGSLIINGGTFKSTKTSGVGDSIYSYGAYYGVSNGYDCSKITITINGGSFDADLDIYGCSGNSALNPVVQIKGGTFNTDGNYYPGTTSITGGTFNVGEGPFWWGWGTDEWFASCGTGWDTAQAWRDKGYTVIASTQYSGYYEIYTPYADSSIGVDDGYTAVETSQSGYYKVVKE